MLENFRKIYRYIVYYDYSFGYIILKVGFGLMAYYLFKYFKRVSFVRASTWNVACLGKPNVLSAAS